MPGQGNKLAHQLLKRVVGAGKADKFTLFEMAPRDVTKFVNPLGLMVEGGLIEKVTVGPCKWDYRLTAKGHEAAIGTKPPKLRNLYPE